ncbi:MAG: sulfatase [Deltaproteobacteria bacterium]|nr:sulfatase [Deltaproteobacteria bacterium]
MSLMDRASRVGVVVAVLLAAAGPASGACTIPADVADLVDSLRSHVDCARRRLADGEASPCTVKPAPACAGTGIDDAIALIAGAGAPSARPSFAARAQVRCQRAILGASVRYSRGRLLELSRGQRQARAAGVFASVRRACDGVPPIVEQGTPLPTLGPPCAASASPAAGALDGTRVARCVRAGLERTLAAMTRPVVPNFVLVLTDDQNLASAASMPRLQSWQRNAVRFRNAFVSTPVCAPSRASLLTGLYAQRHGVISNFLAATTFDSSSTLATWLHDAGYATGIVGKYMNFAQVLPSVPPGWDQWQVLIGEDGGGNGYTDYRVSENGALVQHGGPPHEYSTDLLVSRAEDFVLTHRQEPFFLLFAPFGPHLPAIPAPRHAGSLSDVAPWRPPNWHESIVSAKPTWVKFMKAIWEPAGTIEGDAFRIAQLETLLSVDDALGRLDDLLETTGLADNTVVVFTSDHGYHWGEHWWDSKFSAYDESLRVPMAIRYPVLAPEPADRDEIVLTLDLAPTIATLAGASVPAGLDGRDIGHLLARPGPTRDDILIRNWGAIIIPSWSGVRGERYKYVSLEVTGGVTEELYDVQSDPFELVNLALLPEYGAILDQMRLRLAELIGP